METKTKPVITTNHRGTNVSHDNLIKLLQYSRFSEEIAMLLKDRNMLVNGRLQRLNPFIDNEGISRVGVRLSQAPMAFAQKHSIILSKSLVTSRIIDHGHKVSMHSGTQATLYAVRQRYWPIDGRSHVWRTIKSCVRAVVLIRHQWTT